MNRWASVDNCCRFDSTSTRVRSAFSSCRRDESCSLIQADLTPSAALAVAHEHRPALWVKVALAERECLVDA
jgi:hypothetical protein